MHIKKFVMVISALIYLFYINTNIKALAAPELNVKVTTGFNGKAKYGKGLPITLTVENKGDAFSGDIVLDLANPIIWEMRSLFLLKLVQEKQRLFKLQQVD